MPNLELLHCRLKGWAPGSFVVRRVETCLYGSKRIVIIKHFSHGPGGIWENDRKPQMLAHYQQTEIKNVLIFLKMEIEGITRPITTIYLYFYDNAKQISAMRKPSLFCMSFFCQDAEPCLINFFVSFALNFVSLCYFASQNSEWHDIWLCTRLSGHKFTMGLCNTSPSPELSWNYEYYLINLCHLATNGAAITSKVQITPFSIFMCNVLPASQNIPLQNYTMNTQSSIIL